ncbi:MAG: 4Fe-4S binding protein [Candidatus Aenigmatarchaeota archaeon]
MPIVDERRIKYQGTKGIPFSQPSGPIPKTGDWRTYRPHIDKKKCIRCQTCVMNCPEASISMGKDGFPYVNYHTCKGCLICASGCPVKAITKEEDLHAEHLRRKT